MEKYNIEPAHLHHMAKTLLRIHGRVVMRGNHQPYKLLCQAFTNCVDQWIAGMADPIERACAQSLASGYDDYLDDKSGFFAFDAEAGEVRWVERQS